MAEKDWQMLENWHQEVMDEVKEMYHPAKFKHQNLTANQKQQIRSLYLAVFDKKLTEGCGSCLFDGLVMITVGLRKENQKKQNTMSEQRFKMKEGKVLQIHGSDPMTSKNATDDKVIAMLNRPGINGQAVLDKFFTSYPEDWKDVVKKESKKPAKKKSEDDEETETGKKKENGNSVSTNIDEGEVAKRKFLEAKDEDGIVELLTELKIKKKSWGKMTHKERIELLMKNMEAVPE